MPARPLSARRVPTALMAGLALLALPALAQTPPAQTLPKTTAATTWTPDNGNGTFTNPLFNDEFSDPDIIRVGDDYYMTGTTMHTMPALPVLHSKDLVNWRLLGYALDRLQMGPEYRLEGGRDAYGAGIWAPALRYHNGTFYIFSNINGYGIQVFTATNPAGPWMHKSLDSKIHDLSVLFDDDGKIYAVYSYDEVRLVELKPDLSGVVEGSERVIIPAGNAMGEGHHFYKIKGKYYIISANYAPVGRMQAARSDSPFGPYETVTISARETMGTQFGWRTQGVGRNLPAPGDKISVSPPPPGGNAFGADPLHQGGLVELPNGDWWGFSMMDVKSMGRTTFLSPVTWQDGWPYFGLPGNLGRSPRTWLKPATGATVAPTPTYQRNDDFSGPKPQAIWQWNHVPDDRKWSLSERRGYLRLHSLPAPHFLLARNSLTQRVIGPESTATTTLDAKGLKDGDLAGLGLLNIPYYWLGVVRDGQAYRLRFYDQLTNKTIEAPLPGPRVQLRVSGNYDTELSQFSYSTDGKTFTPIGGDVRTAYQLRTFQGVRYALFAFNEKGMTGGQADFDDFRVDEPLADRSQNIPAGKVVTIRNFANDQPMWANPHGMLHFAANGSKEAAGPGVRFRVHDRGQGRVALEAMDGSGFLTVVGLGLSSDVRLMKTETPDSLFQWQDMLRKQFMLMSLRTHRYLGLDVRTGEPYAADWPGADPDRKDGTVLVWEEVK
ncbi:glycoside hydrolase 43 family protein [Asticcacaulis sp. DXS10W]|uniref:Glycoside hydrolase 43 family protein n=1 Tax=Asticcacaulis currens TaxID=2984210 RepID=A0ABT5ID43_9CAUL|nr:glycoside hydrolase 43 family protein [Asticcacaulis currens]MDC7694088.1 glycoside hydrolase 43 family protein [Asticcacaulis currens]